MEKKVKVLMVTNSLSINGISMVIMNYCQHINLQEFEIHIAAGTPIDLFYLKKYRDLGIQTHELAPRKKKPLEYYRQLKRLMQKNKYDIIHVHGNSTLIFMELLIAKLVGAKVRIAHCHSSECGHTMLHNLMRPFFDRYCTHRFSCSENAGRWIFGNKPFEIITNGFKVERFTFSDISREKLRGQYGLENKFVIGHIGRFNGPKNQEFLIDIFNEYIQLNPDAFLILVGTGPNFEVIKNKVKGLSCKDRVWLYGESDNVKEIYDMFDVFVFPSKAEGLGIVAVEAQISGLRCIMSDTVPHEVCVTDNTCFVSLSEKAQWIDKIDEAYRETFAIDYISNRENCYTINQRAIKNFDICSNVEKLEELYKRCC